MEKTALKRSFSFNGLKLPEPDERMTVEEVRLSTPINTPS